MTTKIGFQGVEHSYSHKAAVKLINEYDLDEKACELKPLITSQTVANELRDGKITYGVVAIQNTVGGVVKETDEAFLSDEWVVKHKYILEINHCLFFKDAATEVLNIAGVVSHPQALKQCKNSISKIFGEVETISFEDTARAAQDLALGILPDNNAVICSKEAGIANGLFLFRSEIQDNANNRTEFILVQKNTEERKEEERLKRFIRNLLFDDSFYNGFIKIAAVPFVLLALPLSSMLTKLFPQWYIFSLTETLGLFVGILLYCVHKFQKYRDQHAIDLITGYWVYMDHVDSTSVDSSQNNAIPRYVVIDSDRNSRLRVRGWLGTNPAQRYFESKSVMHTDLRRRNGSLVYKYSNFSNTKEWAFNGVVELEWSKSSQTVETKNLFGRYYGFLSNTTGGLNFTRISKERFLTDCAVDLD